MVHAIEKQNRMDYVKSLTYILTFKGQILLLNVKYFFSTSREFSAMLFC